MKRCILKFVLFVGIWGFLASCNTNNSTHIPTFPIEEGDLVFRRGLGMASHFIVTSDQVGLYSHTGIVVRQNDSLLILHAVPGEQQKGEIETLKLESAAQFFAPKRAKGGTILRPKISKDLRQIAAQTALNLFNQGITFDHKYNLLDSSQMYCTELVWHAYLKTGFDITQNKRTHVKLAMFNDDFIFPSDIYANSIFDEISSFNY